jgi:hypothetical protein
MRVERKADVPAKGSQGFQARRKDLTARACTAKSACAGLHMVCGRRPSARLPKPEEVQAQTGGDDGRTV